MSTIFRPLLRRATPLRFTIANSRQNLCAKAAIATGVCAAGGAAVLAEPKSREQVIEEYVASLQNDGSFWKQGSFLGSMPSLDIFMPSSGMFRTLASEVLKTAEEGLGCGEPELFFGHRFVKKVRYDGLTHTGVGMSFDMCEAIADTMLADPRVNMRWVPDYLERPMLITLCRLVSCLWFDMVLSMSVEVGKANILAKGLWKLEWSAADRDMQNAETRLRGHTSSDFCAHKRVTSLVTEALSRIDMEAVDVEAARLSTTKDSFGSTVMLPAEVSLLRTAILVALTFVHLLGAGSEMSLGGVSLQVSLEELNAGAAKVER